MAFIVEIKVDQMEERDNLMEAFCSAIRAVIERTDARIDEMTKYGIVDVSLVKLPI